MRIVVFVDGKVDHFYWDFDRLYHNKISRPVAVTVVAITTAVIAALRLSSKNSG